MSCLYVTENGAVIGVQKHRLEVKYKSGECKSIPIETLESIEIFGKSHLSAQAIAECFQRDISVSFYTQNGQYLGCLWSGKNTNVYRQRKQFDLTNDPVFSLEFAKRIIKAKIHNQTVLLRRYARSGSDNANDEILIMLKTEHRVERCDTMDELLGCEGFAARQYFKGLGRLVQDDFCFQRRSKRPPQDEFNAMLSLGYSILYKEILAKVEKKGLNAYLGFMHQDKPKHASLVSDLMEEWRAVIVDAVVMSLVNGNEIKLSHFNKKEEIGIFLNKEGMKIFINKLEKKMRTEIKYLPYLEYAVSFRQALDQQVNQLIKCMEGKNIEIYQPVRIR